MCLRDLNSVLNHAEGVYGIQSLLRMVSTDRLRLIVLANKIVDQFSKHAFSVVIEFFTIFTMLSMRNDMIETLISEMSKRGLHEHRLLISVFHIVI